MMDSISFLISTFKKIGLKDIVLSPGSRNAPLIIAFSEDEYFQIHSVTDERSAAFFALGIRQTANKVALICTSGTALLNYMPASFESYYQEMDLVIVTADRPQQNIQQGHSQTINQVDIFSNINVKTISIEWEVCMDNARAIYKNLAKGLTTHINIHFSEPLYNKNRRQNNQIDNNFFKIEPQKYDNQSLEVLEKMDWYGKRKMILIGQMAKDVEFEKLIKEIAERYDILILSEQTSNIGSQEYIIENIDLMYNFLQKDELEKLRPEILLTFKQNVVSNHIIRYLNSNKPNTHLSIANRDEEFNTFLTSNFIEIKQDKKGFCKDLLKNFQKIESQKEYSSVYLSKNKKLLKQRDILFEDCKFSDLWVFTQLTNENLINKHFDSVHIANSTPIRYIQLGKKIKSKVYSNRGTSGIEGSMSTSLGYQIKSQENTLLIVGDISFLYDSAALWSVSSTLPKKLKILLINNEGGDIFNIIPGPNDYPKTLDYFTTPKKVDFRLLTESYGLEYFGCENKNKFALNWKNFVQTDNMAIFEVKTGYKNSETLKNFWNKIKNQ